MLWIGHEDRIKALEEETESLTRVIEVLVKAMETSLGISKDLKVNLQDLQAQHPPGGLPSLPEYRW